MALTELADVARFGRIAERWQQRGERGRVDEGVVVDEEEPVRPTVRPRSRPRPRPRRRPRRARRRRSLEARRPLLVDVDPPALERVRVSVCLSLSRHNLPIITLRSPSHGDIRRTALHNNERKSPSTTFLWTESNIFPDRVYKFSGPRLLMMFA